MKLCTFVPAAGGHQRIGAVLDDGAVCELPAAKSPWFASMLSFIDGASEAFELGSAEVSRRSSVHKPAAVRLMAPVPEPRQMRDAMSFEKHMRQSRASRHLFGIGGFPSDPAKVELPQVWYEQPIYYKSNRFSVVGPDADVVIPYGETRFDYELEFGVFIGRRGKNIAEADARSHIFGYCIFNDFSARSMQMREMQGSLGPAKGKDFDTGNAMGPWVVTADEIANPENLTMIARVNGEEWSRGNTSEMHHSFARTIAHVSWDETLFPGEFIGSGTVGGGCGIEIGRFLSAGDVVELEVEGLGILRNRVVAGAPLV